MLNFINTSVDGYLEEAQEYAQKDLVDNEADFGGLKVIDYHKLGLDIDYEFVFEDTTEQIALELGAEDGFMWAEDGYLIYNREQALEDLRDKPLCPLEVFAKGRKKLRGKVENAARELAASKGIECGEIRLFENEDMSALYSVVDEFCAEIGAKAWGEIGCIEGSEFRQYLYFIYEKEDAATEAA